ncbi:MAG TPA: epoxyqueuosine reductase, partial [bacterium]|nr:epoxyqueuosine reductase [bacterium]HEX68530.1 epoxyqueuosine reductase [bacterium]
MNEKLTEEVKNYARRLGADLVGIAPVERFKNAPLKMSPQGLFPEGKSVIVVGIHHLDCAVELGGFPTPHDMGPYGIQSSAMNPILDNISFKIARFLEDRGYKTMPIAATNMWRYRPYKDLDVPFAPDLAHRYAAVAAGLGEIGWSGLFLSPEFGPRQRITSIITEAELVPDPMYNGERLCDRCME